MREPQTSRDVLSEVGRLVRGEPDPAVDDKPAEPRKPREKPKTIEDAARLLGVEPADLYDLEVPLRADGAERKARKLGELKDYFSAQDDHSLDRLQWEETRGREQASIARERAELAELLASVPRDKLNAEILDNVRRKIDATVTAERRKTLDRIPEWRDDNTRAGDLAGIAEHLADYGFPAVALQGITDHRMLAYMRDNWLRMKRLQDALDRVKPARTAPQPGRAKSTASPPEPVRESREGVRNLDRQVSAISKLLGR